MDFLGFLDFLKCFNFFSNLWIFFNFNFFGFFSIYYFVFLGSLSKLLRLLLKVTKVTTKSYQGYYWTPKISKNVPKQHYRLFFCPKGKKSLGRSSPQELEVGPHSGPYLLVFGSQYSYVVLLLTSLRKWFWLPMTKMVLLNT